MSNKAFFAALISATLALTISVILLASSYTLLAPDYQKYRKQTESGSSTFVINGADLIVRLGAGGTTRDGHMALTSLAEAGDEKRGIATRPISLQASKYPFIKYEIGNRNRAEHVYLIWRTKEQPEEVFYSPLYQSEGSALTAFLGRNKNWQGHITEIGIDVYGELRGSPLTVEYLILEPPSAVALLRSIWTEWLADHAWTQSSAHTLAGTPTTHPIVSPTAATAAWAAIALVLLGISRLIIPGTNTAAFFIAVFTPWIALDLLWQSDINDRLEEAKYLFADKSQHDRHLAGIDHAFYRYAQHLKNEVLPEPGIKIHLIDDSERRAYGRLKMQYYLLPYNSFNFDRYPRPEHVRPGDYILVLTAAPGLAFSPSENMLRWQDKSIAVQLVDKQTLGSLYIATGASE